jgi:peptidoglycan/xylan/chitin deacetylase (PgdA/CDA1 family)
VHDEVRKLAAAGMTIGAHTSSHPMLSHCPPDIAWAEISQSRACLETALQTQVWAMAYPFGDARSVMAETVKMARDAGYKAAFMNFGGGLGVPLPLHAIPRIHVTREMSLAELEANVSGLHAAFRQRGVSLLRS